MKTFKVCDGNFGLGVSIRVDGNRVEVVRNADASQLPSDLEGILEKMLEEPDDVPHNHGVGFMWWNEEGSSRRRHITTSSRGW